MTESDWLTTTRPAELLAHLFGRPQYPPPVHKLRRLAAWVCREELDDQTDADAVRLLDRLDAFLAGRAKWRNVLAARHVLEQQAWGQTARHPVPWILAASDSNPAAAHLVCHAATNCPALRDIFGNPFRLFAFNPRWRTTIGVTLAEGMDRDDDFSPLPILADALQDAGCEDEHILSHCRTPDPFHVRGCWVVDLVLGRG